MAEIIPFRAMRYNLERVNLSDVVCRPYDIVSPNQKEDLVRHSPFNAVVLDKPDESPLGYALMRQTLAEWFYRGILIPEGGPTFTVTQESFTFGGKKRVRQSLWAAVRLSPFGKGLIYPHENTNSAPKEDRYNLLTACFMNTSPVFGLIPDSSGDIQDQLSAICGNKPMAEASHQGVDIAVHTVQPGGFLTTTVQERLRTNIVIADGHHRYETAMQFFIDIKDGKLGLTPPMNGHAYVLMALTPADNPGLVVAPTHRWAYAQTQVDYEAWMRSIEATHYLHRMESMNPKVWEKDLESEIEGGVFGLIRNEGDDTSGYLAMPKDYPQFLRGLRDQYPGHSDEYYGLDVVTVDRFVTASPISWGPERDPEELARLVQSNWLSLGFLVRPVTPQKVCSLAMAGDRTPPKTTYFDPKQLTGIAFRSLLS